MYNSETQSDQAWPLDFPKLSLILLYGLSLFYNITTQTMEIFTFYLSNRVNNS